MATSLPGWFQGANGDLYGTTYSGGVHGGGTIFRITPSGKLTTVYNFCSQSGCTDGGSPYSAFLQAANGNFFGITHGGGENGYGSIFKITPSGEFTTLYSFCSQPECADGTVPNALVQGTNGTFYGTTVTGGNGGGNGFGTFFSLSTGQAPFVETRPTSGAAGKAVTILGGKLTGATTGKVDVITPDGTLSSNVAFRIP